MGFVGTPVDSASTTPTPAEIRDAVRSALLGNLEAGGLLDHMIAGKRITTYSPEGLIKLDKHYSGLANQEAIGGGITFARTKRRY